MHALDLWRGMNDARGAAITSNTLGTMLDFQGRFGAALKSKQEAFKTFSDLKDKTTWMAEVGGGYGEALVLAGRSDDAKPYLNDALSLSRELKNDGMVAQTLAYQGDAAYYRGDSKSARALYEQALEAATRSKEPARILIAKVALAKIAATEGSAPQAIVNLRQLMQQADDQGVPNLSIDCAISIGEAMIRSHDYAHAQQQLERALVRADKLSLKPSECQGPLLIGWLASYNGKSERRPAVLSRHSSIVGRYAAGARCRKDSRTRRLQNDARRSSSLRSEFQELIGSCPSFQAVAPLGDARRMFRNAHAHIKSLSRRFWNQSEKKWCRLSSLHHFLLRKSSRLLELEVSDAE